MFRTPGRSLVLRKDSSICSSCSLRLGLHGSAPVIRSYSRLATAIPGPHENSFPSLKSSTDSRDRLLEAHPSTDQLKPFTIPLRGTGPTALKDQVRSVGTRNAVVTRAISPTHQPPPEFDALERQLRQSRRTALQALHDLKSISESTLRSPASVTDIQKDAPNERPSKKWASSIVIGKYEAKESPSRKRSSGIDIRRIETKESSSKKRAPKASGMIWWTSPSSSNLKLRPVDVKQPPVAQLSHGLDRVLFNPGVYRLQDPRTRVYNFDPYLEDIMPVSEFDFDALSKYITSSEDVNLTEIARTQQKRYTGSTSSMSTALSHFHYLISAWRRPNFSMLSANFPSPHDNFTHLSRAPAACFLRHQDGLYAIDADKEFSMANVLSMLGKSMEKMLTLDTDSYELYRKANAKESTPLAKPSPETFHYTTQGDFIFRSQLDAHHPSLPGTGMFDLKTRAVVTIRTDVQNYQKLRDYEIVTNQGEWESFEREYHDMIRAAFLKYSLQVRMGRMDGIFVAYHNTQRIFGFQYIPLSDMDYALHGQTDTRLGDEEFKLSMYLLNTLLNKATERFPGKSLRLHFETRPTITSTPFMYFFAEPVPEEQIKEMQNQNHDQERRTEAELREIATSSSEVPSTSWESELQRISNALDDSSDLQVDNIAQFVKSPREDDEEVSVLGIDVQDFTAQDEVSSFEVTDDTAAVLDDLFHSDQIAIDSVNDEVLLEDDLNIDIIEQMRESGPGILSSLESAADASLQLNPSEEADGEESEEGDEVGGGEAFDIKNREETASLNEDKPIPPADASSSSTVSRGEIMAMIVKVRNVVGGEEVVRPERLQKDSPSWQIKYNIEEITDSARAWNKYEACMARRSYVLTRSRSFLGPYLDKMKALSFKGKQRRDERKKREQSLKKVVYGSF